MNIENLSCIEVNMLLERLKTPSNEIDFQRVYNTIRNSTLVSVNEKYKLGISDSKDNIEYILILNIENKEVTV